MTNTCPHCEGTHIATARFCPITGKSLLSGTDSKGQVLVSLTPADRPIPVISAAPFRPFGLVFIVVLTPFKRRAPCDLSDGRVDHSLLHCRCC